MGRFPPIPDSIHTGLRLVLAKNISVSKIFKVILI